MDAQGCVVCDRAARNRASCRSGARRCDEARFVYVDGNLYRTVGTQTDFSQTRAPDHTYDVIYEFFGLQRNVADAAPGNPSYNGERWQVHGLEFTDYPAAVEAYDFNGSGNFDSNEEVEPPSPEVLRPM